MRRIILALLTAALAAAVVSPAAAQSARPAMPDWDSPAVTRTGTPGDATAPSATEAGQRLFSFLPIAAERAANMSDDSATSRIFQMAAVLTLLSFAPALLIMTTSFTRFLIAFSFLRAGLGLQGAPANIVLIVLALFMTFYVMTPVFDEAWETGVQPLMERKIDEAEAIKRVVKPFEKFMLANVREKDLGMFQQLAAQQTGGDSGASDIKLRALAPAFIVSELRRGFEIGFLILLPFLVIDLLVATLVMSMGMMMLSPAVFSLPCKVMFFVLIDGWSLIVNGLVRSFA